MDLTPEQEAQRTTLNDVIAGSYELSPDTDTGQKAMLSEWILASTWVDPEDGQSYTMFLASPTITRIHRIGLAWEALHSWDDSNPAD